MQLHQASNYTQERYDFLKKLEKYEAAAYPDSQWIPTIGVGYNLREPNILNAVLQTLGFDLSGTQLTGAVADMEQYYKEKIEVIAGSDYPPTTDGKKQLQDELNAVMAERAADTSYPDTFTRRTTFTFSSETESKTVFDSIITSYENDVFTQIRNAAASAGKTLDEANAFIESLKGTEELIALVSLKYSGVNFPATATDLLNDNRLAAWYEISYHTNSGSSKSQGIANRRYQEAALFGMWDSGGPTATELANFETFLKSTDPYNSGTFRLQYMRDYEADYPPSNAGIATIDDYINDTAAIKNYFVNKYAQNAIIDGRVIICAELDSDIISTTADLTTSQIKSGYLKSTDKNDLILGGDGDDRIAGGAGNDYILGGTGNDKITGGTGNDYMEGGAGNDIYIINAGDGSDTIEDKQGSNTIIINGTSYTDIVKLLVKQTDGSYKTPDGKIKGVKENTDMVLYDASTGEKLAILNKDFREGDFGIRFQDAPTDPQTNYAITGDLNPLLDINGNPKVDAWGNIISDGTTSPNRNDTIYDTNGNDRIDGKGGNDYLDGGLGNDLIQGGLGSDMLYGVGVIMI